MESIEYLMENSIRTGETSTQKDRKGNKKVKIPYPTTYIGSQPIKIDTDKEENTDIQSNTHSE